MAPLVISLKEHGGEFCTEMVCFRKKKKDKISLDSKLLTKLIRDAGNSNGDNLFMQKP